MFCIACPDAPFTRLASTHRTITILVLSSKFTEILHLLEPLTSRIAYSAIIDVITMGVAQLKPEAQEHLYNIVDSQRSLKIK